MNKKGLIGVLVLLVVLGIGWQLASKDSVTKETGPIKVGFIGPLTGDVSSIGTIDKAAVELAVEEINAAGGVNGRPLEVTYEDGKCDATEATKAAQKLIHTDKVVAIIGGLCSTETSAFGPLAMQNKVIVISYGASAPSLSKLGKYFFRDYHSDSLQGKFAAEYAYNVLGARKVATLYHVSDYGTGLKEVFEKRFTELGGTVVASEGAPQETRDYRTVLTKIRGASPDLIYGALYTEGAITVMEQALQLGVTTQMLGGESWDDPKVQKAAAGKGTFLYIIQDAQSSAGFESKIMAKTGGDEVPVSVANAYDAVQILVLAMKEAGTDPDKLQDTLRSLKYDGASGHIEFDENGDLKTTTFKVKKIENGTVTVVE